MLADALTALAAAVTAWRCRFADQAVPTWTLVAAFTGGQMLGRMDYRRDQQVGVRGMSLSELGHHREDGPPSRR